MLLGPNTALKADHLARNVLLVAGEDAADVLKAMSRCACPITPLHRFRCYEFYACPEMLLVLSGIGTGCMEPLLWEILRPGIVQRIVLAGTAGSFPMASVAVGQPYVIRTAYAAGTSLDAEFPAAPRWSRMPAGVPTAVAVSTDYFYGFAPRLVSGAYPAAPSGLAGKYARLSEVAQLVEMETASFYHFCERFGPAGMEYVAIKGVSNVLEQDEQQLRQTISVMERCIGLALELLRSPR